MTYLLLALWLTTALALGAGLRLSHRRASRARRELAESIHDRALALDRRADHLQGEIGRLAERRRIDHLLDLVALGEAEGRLDGEAARRLRRFALELYQESRPAPPGAREP